MRHKIRLVNLNEPAMSRGFIPKVPMIEREEKVILAGVPNLPFKRSKRGIKSKRSNHQGCARLRLWKYELIVSVFEVLKIFRDCRIDPSEKRLCKLN